MKPKRLFRLCWNRWRATDEGVALKDFCKMFE